MCQFESAIVVNLGDDIRVYTHPTTSSHSKIRKYHKLGESTLADRASTLIELVPVDDLFDIGSYKLIFDDEKPEWWKDWMEVKVRAKLKKVIKKKLTLEDGVIKYEGNLYLRSITSLPEGIEFNVGGRIYLKR